MAVQRKRSFVEGVVIEKNEQFLILETDIYQYPQAKDLILNRDIPPDIKPEFKVYHHHFLYNQRVTEYNALFYN